MANVFGLAGASVRSLPRSAACSLRSERGQSAVEFILMFPFVLVMIMFLVEFGFALNTYITVHNAASEAARYAAVANLPGSCNTDPDAPSVEGRAVNASGNLVTCDEVAVRYDKKIPGTQFLRGDGVAVHIAHLYETVSPLGGLMSAFSWGAVPASFTMTACSEARLESQPGDQTLLVAGAGCD